VSITIGRAETGGAGDGDAVVATAALDVGVGVFGVEGVRLAGAAETPTPAAGVEGPGAQAAKRSTARKPLNARIGNVDGRQWRVDMAIYLRWKSKNS
jgi:hypothetical protein